MTTILCIGGVLALAWIGGWLEERREKRLRRYFSDRPDSPPRD
jgi:hypothetical protein